MEELASSRKVIAVIGCQVLEDEVSHVIGTDPEIQSIFVLESPQAMGIADKFRRLGREHVHEVKPEDLDAALPQNGLSAVVWIKPIGLHQSPAHLREEVVANARQLAPLCDSILIFYGLCGNAFRGIDDIAEEFDVPLIILRDGQGLIVDDCIGAVLGGSEEYRAFLLRDKGGYTLNTMWAANWRHFMVETQFLHDPNDPEEVGMVLQCLDYRNVVMLDTGLGDREAFRRQAEELARIFGLGNSEEQCTLRVVEESYRLAKSRMR
jgi:hypothetical protein